MKNLKNNKGFRAAIPALLLHCSIGTVYCWSIFSQEIADYIASLEMSVFVYDYDHNAPSVEYLEQTHERMFLQIREKQPDLPIILMSRPEYNLSI